jgi:hypothetical protein
MVAALVAVCTEAVVRAKFVKGRHVDDLAFKNTRSSANIVRTFTCQRNGLDRNKIRG